jgi:hypothetical protein
VSEELAEREELNFVLRARREKLAALERRRRAPFAYRTTDARTRPSAFERSAARAWRLHPWMSRWRRSRDPGAGGRRAPHSWRSPGHDGVRSTCGTAPCAQCYYSRRYVLATSSSSC